MRLRSVPLVLTTCLGAGALSLTLGALPATGAPSAGGAPPCPPVAPSGPAAPDAPDTAPPDTATPGTVPRPDDLASRCDLDPESYFLAYTSGEAELATTAMPSATGVVPMQATAEDANVALPEPGPLDDNTFVDAGESSWVATRDDRESTFALDVDTGSFGVAHAFLQQGYRPEPDSIRPEEWINAYSYGDQPPEQGALGLTVESGRAGTRPDDPVLVRVGVSTRELGALERPPANITFVIDTSGSMDIRERLGLVKASLALLVRSLRDDDSIAIVTYGDMASPVLAPTPVAEWRSIVEAIDALAPGGSTNMEAGLRLGYEQARSSFDPAALNVVVLASDGVANQGVTDADELTADITQAGDEGIHLVTVGYGMGNYNDHLMERLADQGDGFYSYVDEFSEAVRLFVDDLTPTLTVVAEEARAQVVFDDAVVARYRLVGYENRELDDAQFSDDSVDAGELGAGHQVSALYELQLVEEAPTSAAAGEVRLRWRDAATGDITELASPLDLAAADAASPSLRLAATVGHAAEVLRGSSSVLDRGLTLESLLVEAEELAADGIDGAAELAELLQVAISAEPPSEPGAADD